MDRTLNTDHNTIKLESFHSPSEAGLGAHGSSQVSSFQYPPSNQSDGAYDTESNAQQNLHLEEASESELPPSRGYQAALIAAGFMMIFQVIGINSVYGIFQVSFTYYAAW